MNVARTVFVLVLGLIDGFHSKPLLIDKTSDEVTCKYGVRTYTGHCVCFPGYIGTYCQKYGKKTYVEDRPEPGKKIGKPEETFVSREKNEVSDERSVYDEFDVEVDFDEEESERKKEDEINLPNKLEPNRNVVVENKELVDDRLQKFDLDDKKILEKSFVAGNLSVVVLKPETEVEMKNLTQNANKPKNVAKITLQTANATRIINNETFGTTTRTGNQSENGYAEKRDNIADFEVHLTNSSSTTSSHLLTSSVTSSHLLTSSVTSTHLQTSGSGLDEILIDETRVNFTRPGVFFIANENLTSFKRYNDNESSELVHYIRDRKHGLNELVISSGEMSSSEFTEAYTSGEVECKNGIIQEVFKQCSCDVGYTGEYCQTGFLYYSGSGDSPQKRQDGVNLCHNGIPIYVKSCLCHFGYTGVSCNTELKSRDHEKESSGYLQDGGSGDENYHFSGSGDFEIYESEAMNSGAGSGFEFSGEVPKLKSLGSAGSGSGSGFGFNVHDLDRLSWDRAWDYLAPHHQVALPYNLIENFVVVATGVEQTETKLHYTEDVDNKTSNMYRFTFIPHENGGKSRLELSTCFVTEPDLMRLFGSPILDPTLGTSLITHCDVVNKPAKSLHTYSYDVYIPRDAFPQLGNYIIAQWHGSPNPNTIKDDQGCIAMISNHDRNTLCSMGSCKQGKIYDDESRYIGLRYQQGGYPPLTFALRDGIFTVLARSDERMFIEKGGCPFSNRTKTNFTCPLQPRQQYHVLLEMPFNDFVFDEWVKFEWKIKWSEYSVHDGKVTDAGLITSNAWIRLYLDGMKLIDWRGPCGRNEEGRIPFFKTGIYNPSGSPYPLRMFFRRYHHDVNDVDDEMVKKLIVTENHNPGFIGRNRFLNKEIFIKTSGSCTLQPKVNHLAEILETKFSRLKVDKKTRMLLQTITYALQEHDLRMSSLEERLNRCENRDDYDVDNHD